MKLKRLLKEYQDNPAGELCSLLAHPNFKKELDALRDSIEPAKANEITAKYDALYNEFKKYDE
jgi:hypothetical protein